MRFYHYGGIGLSQSAAPYVDEVITMHPADKRFNAISFVSPMYILNTKDYYSGSVVTDGGINDGLEPVGVTFNSLKVVPGTNNFIIIQNTYRHSEY